MCFFFLQFQIFLLIFSQVDDKLRASLLLPIDECFDKMKTDTFEKFGQNIAQHIVCSKKIQQN